MLCGDEGSEQRLNLTDGGRRVLRFLTEAIFSMPLSGYERRRRFAEHCLHFRTAEKGINFGIVAGDGDWEFYFAESADSNICWRCKRMPRKWYIWDG